MVALQLSWESPQQGGVEVRATLEAAGEHLDLSQLYLGLHPASSNYRLCAMLCYRTRPGGSDSACQAFLLDGDTRHWLATSPASAALGHIGGWAAVMQKCAAERIQPSLLFYMALA